MYLRNSERTDYYSSHVFIYILCVGKLFDEWISNENGYFIFTIRLHGKSGYVSIMYNRFRNVFKCRLFLYVFFLGALSIKWYADAWRAFTESVKLFRKPNGHSVMYIYFNFHNDKHEYDISIMCLCVFSLGNVSVEWFSNAVSTHKNAFQLYR